MSSSSNSSPEPIVYKGMTLTDLRKEYNPDLTIPNVATWLQKNRELGQEIKTKLNPISDLAYGKEALQKLDIYAPANAQNLPVLIDIHGGGWIAGSKNPRSIPAEAIMSQGVIWVPIDYGLSPEFNMQEIIAHVRSALVWIYKNIQKFGGDPNRLYITGASAGAHLAAAAMMPGWHEEFEVPEDLIKGALLLSGVYDLEYLVHSDLPWARILNLSSEDALSCSPIHHPPNLPIPVIIAYGENETSQFHLQSKEYADALAKTGCSVNLIEIAHAHHYETMNVLADRDAETYKLAIDMLL